jgi:peptide/nickel transport system substrate-binding protein
LRATAPRPGAAGAGDDGLATRVTAPVAVVGSGRRPARRSGYNSGDSNRERTRMNLTRRDLLRLGGVGLAMAGAGSDLARPGPAEAQQPRRGGVFRLSGFDPQGFDPHQTLSYRSMTILSMTHSRLVRVKAGPTVRPGSTPIEADLAESWSRPDATTWVFKLRRGVRWHPKPPVNGRELTAEDVVYTYERFMTIKGNQARSLLDPVDRVEAPDRHTVRFRLKEPFAWFLDVMASTSMLIVAREAVDAHGDLKRAESCVGTGPWMLEGYEPNVRLTLARHPEYFVSGLPYADGVEVSIDQDHATRFANFAAGKYDFGPEYNMVLRRLDLETARQRRPGLRTAEFVLPNMNMTWMKLDQAPFADVRVRRAMAMALNWKDLVAANAWAHGHGVQNPAIPAAFRDWSIPLDQLPPEGRRLYTQDIPAARRLLTAAGLPDGFATTVETTAGYGSDYMDGVQAMLANWKAAGIQTDLQLKEYGAFLATTIAGKFERVALGLFGGWTDPDSYLYRLYIPGQASNAGGVDDPRLTDMIRLQRRTFDPARRREILYDIQRYLSRQCYYIYGPSFRVVVAWDPAVKDFAPNIGHDYGGRLMAAWLDR